MAVDDDFLREGGDHTIVAVLGCEISVREEKPGVILVGELPHDIDVLIGSTSFMSVARLKLLDLLLLLLLREILYLYYVLGVIRNLGGRRKRERGRLGG